MYESGAEATIATPAAIIAASPTPESGWAGAASQWAPPTTNTAITAKITASTMASGWYSRMMSPWPYTLMTMVAAAMTIALMAMVQPFDGTPMRPSRPTETVVAAAQLMAR